MHHSNVFKEQQSKRYIGNGNPRWKGGQRKYWGNYWITYFRERDCNLCGTKGDLLAHHKDRNWRNNVPENIQILCRSCHTKEHKRLGHITKPKIFKDRREFYEDWKIIMR